MSTTLTSIPRTYAELLRNVQRVLFTGRNDIDAAWVRTYHEIGRLIQEHILLNQARADYGAGVYSRLSADTKASKRVLYECTQFYRCFPIVRPAAQLTWTHYQLLCQIDDPRQRAALVAETKKQGLQTTELKARVRSFNSAREILDASSDRSSSNVASAAAPSPPPLPIQRGAVGRYRIVDLDGSLCVDLGFKLHLPLSPAQARHRCAGGIVAVDSAGGIDSCPEGRTSDLFNYVATVRRIIDGDTLEVALVLPHIVLREKLRLRGLDCPELPTPEGRAARRAVEALVRGASRVTIRTTKPDKYDRYLADVFLDYPDGSTIFLNNHLLAHGFAERKDAWEFSDWEKAAAR